MRLYWWDLKPKHLPPARRKAYDPGVLSVHFQKDRNAVHIDDHFDSGNIEIVQITADHCADLRIKMDAGDEHMQWFYFRVDGARNKECTFRLVNAGAASYPRAWDGYRVCTSTDRQIWTRVDTTFEEGVLTIKHRPETQMQCMPILHHIPTSSTSSCSRNANNRRLLWSMD